MVSVDECFEILFKIFDGNRGKLVSIESNKNIPFSIDRVFYIFGTDTDNTVRGKHANKESEFVMVCLSGSCKVLVKDGVRSKEFLLDSPHKGIYLPKMIWKEMFDFSKNCVLLVLSNMLYDSNEYINDFDEYINCIK